MKNKKSIILHSRTSFFIEWGNDFPYKYNFKSNEEHAAYHKHWGEAALKLTEWMRNKIEQKPHAKENRLILYPSLATGTDKDNNYKHAVELNNWTYLHALNVEDLGGFESTIKQLANGLKRFWNFYGIRITTKDSKDSFLQDAFIGCDFYVSTDERCKPESINEELRAFEERVSENPFKGMSYDPTSRCSYDKGQNFDWVIGGNIYFANAGKDRLVLMNNRYKI